MKQLRIKKEPKIRYIYRNRDDSYITFIETLLYIMCMAMIIGSLLMK